MLGQKRLALEDPKDKDSYGIMLSFSDGAQSTLGDLKLHLLESQKTKDQPRIQMVSQQ